MAVITKISDVGQYQEFIAQPGCVMVKYYKSNCNPCKILAPTFNKVVDRMGCLAAEVCLDDWDSGRLPQVVKVPTVEYFRDGKSTAVISGMDLRFKTLIEIYEQMMF